MTTPNFFQHAACHNHPTKLFIPDTPTKTQTNTAKQICNTCPVQQPCLNYALKLQQHTDLQGIFGGTTPYERRKMIKNPHPPQPTPSKHTYTHGTLYGYRQAKCRCHQCKAAHTRTINRQRRQRKENH